MNCTNNSGFKKTLMEKGEEFFKIKNKDLEKIKQFEENNFLKCNSKDYSQLFTHKKTNESKPKISGSFYQNIENPISSRSDGKRLRSNYSNYNKTNNNINNNKNSVLKNRNDSSKTNDILLSINKQQTKYQSKLLTKESISGMLKEKLNSDFPLEIKNIKSVNFTLKNENEFINQAKDKSRKSSLFNEEFGLKAQQENAALNHRKTKSLELHNKIFSGKDLNFDKKESFGSIKSNAKSVKEENNIQRIRKIYTKGNLSNQVNVAELKAHNENENIKFEELRDKMNKASFLDTSN